MRYAGVVTVGARWTVRPFALRAPLRDVRYSTSSALIIAAAGCSQPAAPVQGGSSETSVAATSSEDDGGSEGPQPVCVPGQRRCGETPQVVEVCDETGLAWSAGTEATANQEDSSDIGSGIVLTNKHTLSITLR